MHSYTTSLYWDHWSLFSAPHNTVMSTKTASDFHFYFWKECFVGLQLSCNSCTSMIFLWRETPFSSQRGAGMHIGIKILINKSENCFLRSILLGYSKNPSATDNNLFCTGQHKILSLSPYGSVSWTNSTILLPYHKRCRARFQ